MPAVSVLMPCYNAASTVEETLDSLSRQTLSDYEIIAVDDGSTDRTLEILLARALREQRYHVLALPHQGIIESLNAGLSVCNAPFIARMDADDRSHPERLERQVIFLDEHPNISVVGCLVEGFPKETVGEGFQIYLDWLNSMVTNDEIQRQIFVESPLAHPSVTFRREDIERLGGYQEFGWPEDYDLWLRLYLSGATFAKIPKTLLEWREHPDRLTRVDSRYSLENFLRAKAHYLARGPLDGRDAVFIWGAGMMGRRISKHLLRQNIPLVAFIDIDPKKIGRTRRGFPIISADELPSWWSKYTNPVLLAAVGARGARALIRERLTALGLREGEDWWSVA